MKTETNRSINLARITVACAAAFVLVSEGHAALRSVFDDFFNAMNSAQQAQRERDRELVSVYQSARRYIDTGLTGYYRPQCLSLAASITAAETGRPEPFPPSEESAARLANNLAIAATQRGGVIVPYIVEACKYAPK